MKNKYKIIITMIVLIGFTGCSVQDKIDEYKNDDDKTTTENRSFTSATIKYNDGAVMGVTKAEAGVNGGFQIYHIGTGEVIGFIQPDGKVNDIGGVDLGVCSGAVISDTGVSGDCIVPAENPNKPKPVKPQTPQQPQTPGQPQKPTKPVITDPNCPDTRNGDFNPSYSPAVCNGNGYFWCSVAKQCLNKPINVNECGEIWERS